MKTIGLVGGTSWVSSADYYKLINTLASKGAEGIVLACTEIPLLIKQSDCSSPLFDTLAIHVDAAVQYALS